MTASLFASAANAQTVAALPGQAVDLSRTASGDLLVTTENGHVIEVTSLGVQTVLANPGDFARPTIASVSLGPGSAAVIDDTGSIYEVGTVPGVPQLIYSDVYIIREPTDLSIDANGDFWIACKTISNNTRCVAHVSSDGQRWSYFSVDRSPAASAPDALSGGLVLSDTGAGLILLTADDDGAPVREAIGPASGFQIGRRDGDVALTSNGDIYVASNFDVLLHDRMAGTTGTFMTFPGPVRGLAFAPASTGGGDSLWVVEGNGLSNLREVLLGATAANDVMTPIWPVPGTGTQLTTYGLNVNSIVTDRDGHLLVGGDVFGSVVKIDRITLPGLVTTNVADGADGLTSRIEGMHLDRDGTIHALTRFGAIHTVTETGGAPIVGMTYTDPFDQIVVGKDMFMDRVGDAYVAARQGWSFGIVGRLTAPGQFSSLVALQDTRGVLPDVFGPRVLANEWNSTGFEGTVGVVDEQSGLLLDLPGFTGLNLSNQENVGDGDMVMDATGRIYVGCEDEFAVRVWNPQTERVSRIGSGYLNRASGLTISRSTNPLTSSTGFSLYVSQWNRLHEIEGVPPPAPRMLDLDAPGAGKVLGWVRPEWGRPVALCYDQAGAQLAAVTDDLKLVGLPLDGSPASLLADATSGLTGDLTAVAADPSGELLVGNSDGLIYRLSPLSGYMASLEFADGADEIANLVDLVNDAGAGTFLLDGATDPDGVSRLYELSNGVLEPVAITFNGRALGLDPVSGDIFVAQGATSTSPGEVLRVHMAPSPALVNHWPSNRYTAFDVDDLSRGITFDGDGNLLLASAQTGRVTSVDRALQSPQVFAGNYDEPTDLVVAPGRVGIAGLLGASVFVLDGYCVYEHGIDAAVPVVPFSRTLDPDPFMVPAIYQFGQVPGNSITLESPTDAGLPFLLLPGSLGQLNPFALASLGNDPGDPRVIAQDFDQLWIDAASGTVPFQAFLGVFDGAGVPIVPIQFNVPNQPALVGLDLPLDLTWVSLDALSPNSIRTVGGTTQFFLGL
ncbi:hypothetical protein [Planctomycetes bacterium Pla163]|uniref:hypothetical protein n=1 Tax=Rohdeia mirabilis TaxID=2528008 RepID=UPI0011A46FEC